MQDFFGRFVATKTFREETMNILETLLANQDLKYRDFQSPLIPGLPKEKMIGVRTPVIRSIAKELIKSGEWSEFIATLPHEYYEENLLHGKLLGMVKTDYAELVALIEEFLPHIDNWAVCDTIAAHRLLLQPDDTYNRIKQWLRSDHPYTVRFGLVCLLQMYMDEHFRPEILDLAVQTDSEHYYVRMGVAWMLSYALIKQYDATLPLIESGALPKWTHNKTIQKAIESYRITDDRKAYLKSLRKK